MEQPSVESKTRSVRPKHRPSHLRDFEVEYTSHMHTPQVACEVQPVKEDQERRRLYYEQARGRVSSPSPHRVSWDITLDEWEASPISTPLPRDRSHSSRWRRKSGRENPRVLARTDATPLSAASAGPSEQSTISSLELEEIRRENRQLRQTQLAVRADLKRLQIAKDEMSELMEKVGKLQVYTSTYRQQHSNFPESPGDLSESEEEEDWPEPPPWIPYDEYQDLEGRSEYRSPHLPPTVDTMPTSSTSHSSITFPSPAPRLTALQAPQPDLTTNIAATSMAERYYRGPSPSIPHFHSKDPSAFARLKMSLENLLPPDSTEMFKYQVLVDHLKVEEASLIAESYLHSPTPYSDTIAALNERFGQPHQIVLKRIASIMDSPNVNRNDPSAFEKFALQVQSLVGMLRTLGPAGGVELECGSHVARLLNKLPPERRADFRRFMLHRPGATYSMSDFAEWLKFESWCQGSDDLTMRKDSEERAARCTSQRPHRSIATILLGAGGTQNASSKSEGERAGGKAKPYCPYCKNSEHFFSQCPVIPTLAKDQVGEWIKANKRCWRCARQHLAAQCDLKKPCPICQRRHLRVLHAVNDRVPRHEPKEETCLVSAATKVFHLDRPGTSSRVLLKITRVFLHYQNQTIDTFAILDDGSERTMLLPDAARRLGILGTPEHLSLRTISHEIQTLQGASVSFHVSPFSQPEKRFQITGAFTAPHLVLAEHSYPSETLKRKYKHLVGLPIPQFENAKPLVLIGADHPHIITPIEPVRLGPPGGPAAIRTRLGWTLQGPTRLVEQQLKPHQCLFTSTVPSTAELLKNVEKLWQVDVIPFQSEKEVTRSRQDREAIDLLQSSTTRVNIKGTWRYATPLLRKCNRPQLHAPMEAVMPRLRSVERRLSKDPQLAEIYKGEIQRLVQSGAVVKLRSEDLEAGSECWFLPHHLVHHSSKPRVVFDCSFQFQGVSLNDTLLPGPTLGPSLLGVLLRFREHAVAISADIRAMFHQVHLLPEDRSLLRFVWRDLKKDESPDVFEWQVLPFGTTCSPCCATFALQYHVREHSRTEEDARLSVEQCFYVDNCLQSVPSAEVATRLVKRLRELLALGGFELRQWASNVPCVISHLPREAKSDSAELWLAHSRTDAHESTLGLSWNCPSDTLAYKHRPLEYEVLTMRVIYKVLASQYDPLGFILPYTTRAKILVQRLWDQQRGWDDPHLPHELRQAWKEWEDELQLLPSISIPRPYVPVTVSTTDAVRDLHVFCDASEKAYGSVAYLRTQDSNNQVHLSFVMARSRVAPKRMLSMPRLELCGAVSGAQLAQLLEKELTLQIRHTVFWTDSTTVLRWLQSDSCHFKVFVGTRVAEIHELTKYSSWRYVDSPRNPADDLTRGKTLKDLIEPNRWSQGPSFLLQGPEEWPTKPEVRGETDPSELCKLTFCGSVSDGAGLVSVGSQHPTWQELIDVTAHELHGAAAQTSSPSSDVYMAAETHVLQKIQQDCFPEEVKCLKAGKSLHSGSRILTLAPEYDESFGLIRVGGRLRRAEALAPDERHPIVLDPKHPSVRLLLHDYDERLKHPGPERVYAEVRRRFWILRGREAIRHLQHNCLQCRKWRSNPAVPKMADLPTARLQLFKPPFYSTGVDCFGPFQVKIGRRLEKRWGILFKCLTTQAIHLDLLYSLDVDSFLMALRRFLARRGHPAELYSDQGTNFKAGERELHEAFTAMSAELQHLLAKRKIAFHFNPPASPHFGGVWEREVRSVKAALYKTVGAQSVTEEVLRTVLLEVEAILNSKPLGYVSSDVADIDPITPSFLLMGRRDGALPQVLYPQTECLSRRRWRYSQTLADQFWSAFIRHFLPNLQVRNKWHHELPGIGKDTVVLVMDPQLPRAHWSIGKVCKVHPSSDGQVRSAEVQIGQRTYVRPVARLIVLPTIPEERKAATSED